MKPNIVFFFSDQQRWDTLGCNGQPLDITPHIDLFSSEGINYTNTFAPQPVCGPARAMLQTGLYPTQIGCFRNAISLPTEQKTLAHHMREAGYNVGYVGKWHLASDEHENHYETTAVPPERRGGYNDYWMASDVLEFTSHGYGGYVHDQYGNRVEFSGYRADCITDYAINYIHSYNSEKPFFLFVSHIEPHHQNDRNNYEGPLGKREEYEHFVPPADLERGKGDWEEFFPDYLSCCNSLDYNFGRVVECLKSKGIFDNTVLVYASDHGCHFRTHTEEVVKGGYDDYKRNTFENTIHVPLIIGGPGFSGGKKVEKLVSLIDLPKTLLSIADCDIPNEIQGRDIRNIDDKNWENAVYIQISESYVGRAVRTARYKYVVYAPDKNPWTESASSSYIEKYLFDLHTDPLEKENLIHERDYLELKAMLRMRLIQFAQQAGEGTITIEAGE